MYDLILSFLLDHFLGSDPATMEAKTKLAENLAYYFTIFIFVLIFYFIYLIIKAIIKPKKWD